MRKALLLACCFLSGRANLDKEARSDDAQCATHGMHPDSTYYLQCRAQLGAARVQTKPGQIRCQVGPDCDEKWARANKWVTDDLGLKIQTKTDVLIKTVQSPQDTRMLGRVDGFDQDEAESERDERAVILRRLSVMAVSMVGPPKTDCP